MDILPSTKRYPSLRLSDSLRFYLMSFFCSKISSRVLYRAQLSCLLGLLLAVAVSVCLFLMTSQCYGFLVRCSVDCPSGGTCPMFLSGLGRGYGFRQERLQRCSASLLTADHIERLLLSHASTGILFFFFFNVLIYSIFLNFILFFNFKIFY